MKRDFLRLFALTTEEYNLIPLRKVVERRLLEWDAEPGTPFDPLREDEPKEVTCAVSNVIRFVRDVKSPTQIVPPPFIQAEDSDRKVQRLMQAREAYEKTVEIAKHQYELILDLAATILELEDSETVEIYQPEPEQNYENVVDSQPVEEPAYVEPSGPVEADELQPDRSIDNGNEIDDRPVTESVVDDDRLVEEVDGVQAEESITDAHEVAVDEVVAEPVESVEEAEPAVDPEPTPAEPEHIDAEDLFGPAEIHPLDAPIESLETDEGALKRLLSGLSSLAEPPKTIRELVTYAEAHDITALPRFGKGSWDKVKASIDVLGQ